MSTFEADQRSENHSTTKDLKPPGVYRSLAAIEGSASSSVVNPTATAPTSDANVISASADARHRFYQLRSLRREMCGRPPVLTQDTNALGDASSPATLSAAPPVITQLHATPSPLATSFGVPLDRLPPEEAATRYILRTAAAERALRQQQAENDALKHRVVEQRREVEALRLQLENASRELAASSQTVLRQTATMRSLTAAMERRDAYHLIKDRRSSQEVTEAAAEAGRGTAAAAAAAQEQQERRIGELELEVAQLKTEKAALEEKQKNDSLSAAGRSTVEAIDREEEDDAAKDESVGQGQPHNTWLPMAADELQRLVQTFGRLLHGRHPSPRRLYPSSTSQLDSVYEVTLRDVSFTSNASAPCPDALSSCKTQRFLSSQHGVLWLCGPYNTHNLLLRAYPVCTPATRPLPSPRERQTGRFYALPETDGLLWVHYFDSVEIEESVRDEAQVVNATASATIPVRSILTCLNTPFAESAVSTVHTLHVMKPGESRPYGAATFAVDVVLVRPAVLDTLRVSHGGRVAPSLVGSVATSISHSPPVRRWVEGEGIADVRNTDGHFSPDSGTATPSLIPVALTSEASSVVAHRRRATPLLSPSRELSDAVLETHRRLSAPSSTSSHGEAQGSAFATAASPSPAVVDEAQTTKETPEEAREEEEVAVVTGEGTKAESSKDAGSDVLSSAHREGGTATKSEVGAPAPLPSLPFAASPPPPPAVATTGTPLVPLPPLVSVPQPPAAVPAKPSPPPPPSPITNVHFCVKTLSDFDSGGVDDVEGLLEHCAVQVDVNAAEQLLVRLPPRHNPSHAVWAADEGSGSAALLPTQDLRFTVRAANVAPTAVLAEAVVHAADVVAAPGERSIALTSRSTGAPCGTLKVRFDLDTSDVQPRATSKE